MSDNVQVVEWAMGNCEYCLEKLNRTMPVRVGFDAAGEVVKVLAPCGHPKQPEDLRAEKAAAYARTQPGDRDAYADRRQSQ